MGGFTVYINITIKLMGGQSSTITPWWRHSGPNSSVFRRLDRKILGSNPGEDVPGGQRRFILSSRGLRRFYIQISRLQRAKWPMNINV